MNLVDSVFRWVAEVSSIYFLVAIWLGYIVPQVISLIEVVSRPDPQPVPRTVYSAPITHLNHENHTSIPHLRRLRFEDFNVDIILGIFSYYVASQTNGAFILTLVSTSWRDFVLQSPILWQWITVDDQSPDWVETALLCHTLSEPYHLQIVVRLPIMEWEKLLPLLTRCQNLLFEIPDYMTGRDVSQATEKLFKIFTNRRNCQLHYYRAGQYLLQESREPHPMDLSRALKLELVGDGSEHPNYHRYAQTRSTRYLEDADGYHPLILLKVYDVLEIMRNASSLRQLIISHYSMDPIFSELDLPLVTVVQLDELRITGIDYYRNGSLVSLIQSIKCPNLSTLSLSGNYDDILDVAERIGEIANPSNLEFKYGSYVHLDMRMVPSFQLPSVTCLRVQIDDRIDNASGDKANLAASIDATLHTAVNATVLRLVLPSDWCERGKNTVVYCVRHSIPSDTTCELPCHDTTTLEFFAGDKLNEIDIKLTSHVGSLSANLSPVPPCNIGPRIFFNATSLTSLVCTPYVLLPFLSQNNVNLRSIQLHLPQERSSSVVATSEELDYFDKNITVWVMNHVEGHRPLKVHTFGLSWFPNWECLVTMIYKVCQGVTMMEGITLKLPGYPHPSIQWELALAMGATDDGRERSPLPVRPFLRKWRDNAGFPGKISESYSNGLPLCWASLTVETRY